MKKNAIVTGCAKGIGRQIALSLARDGYNIIGTYNTSYEDILSLKNKIENIGVDFEYYKVDFVNDNEIEKFCNFVINKYKKIDFIVNNAAKSIDNDFHNKTSNEFREVLQINLVAPFIIIQKLSYLLNGGIVINIASTDGINTYGELNIDYSASKAGLINLTKSLSLILKDTSVYALCPNWVNTESVMEMNPDYLNQELARVNQSRLIEPAEVSKKIIEIIEGNFKTGSVIVMEDSYDK